MTVATTPSPAAQRAARRPEPARRMVDRRSADGAVLGQVELDPDIFGLVPNVAVLHQVCTAQLAAARAGTQSTRTRAEVAGGGAKPFRQKGTGRARQGSTRAPQWSGGGVAMGPKPRSYRQRTPKKMIRLALYSALSDRASEQRVALVDSWGLDEPKTKAAVAALGALGLTGRIMVVLAADDLAAQRSFTNLQRVQVVPVTELNAYDVMRSDWVVFTDESLPGSPGSSADDVVEDAGAPGASVADTGAGAPDASAPDASAPDAGAAHADADADADASDVGVSDGGADATDDDGEGDR
jgi:large subunit ribosomal protein L4